MKHRFLLSLMAIFSIVTLFSCQKQQEQETPDSVAVITKPIATGETGAAGTRAVTIAATCPWTAVSQETWITVSPSSGEKGMQEVILAYEENTSGIVRQGVVTFTARGGYSESFTLTQNAK